MSKFSILGQEPVGDLSDITLPANGATITARAHVHATLREAIEFDFTGATDAERRPWTRGDVLNFDPIDLGYNVPLWHIYVVVLDGYQDWLGGSKADVERPWSASGCLSHAESCTYAVKLWISAGEADAETDWLVARGLWGDLRGNVPGTPHALPCLADAIYWLIASEQQAQDEARDMFTREDVGDLA